MRMGQQTSQVSGPDRTSARNSIGSPCAIWAVDSAAEKISISDAPALRRLVDGALAEPAEPVRMDDLDELVFVLAKPQAHQLVVGRHEAGRELVRDEALHRAEAVRDRDRSSSATARAPRAPLGQEGKGSQVDAESALAVADDAICLAESLRNRHLVAHHDERPIAVRGRRRAPTGPP